MSFSPKALVVWVAVMILLVAALSSNGGALFRVAEALATVGILYGVTSQLRERYSTGRGRQRGSL